MTTPTRLRRGALAWAGAAVAALGLTACATADVPEPVATPSPTVSVPAKQAPVVAPSTSPSASEASQVTVASQSPSPEPSEAEAQDEDGASDDSGSASEDKDSGASLEERSEAIAKELFDLANEARAEADRDELEWKKCAAEQAVDRAEDARKLADLKHAELEFDCTATIVGENLVRGDGPADALHQLWMDSEGHRKNILNSDFDSLGVGCAAHARGDRTKPAKDAGDIGGWVCSEMFYG